MQHDPPRRHDNNGEHDRRFREFGHPRADAGNDPQRTDRAKYEASTEDKREVKYARFQNLCTHRFNRDRSLDSVDWLALGVPAVVHRGISA